MELLPDLTALCALMTTLAPPSPTTVLKLTLDWVRDALPKHAQQKTRTLSVPRLDIAMLPTAPTSAQPVTRATRPALQATRVRLTIPAWLMNAHQMLNAPPSLSTAQSEPSNVEQSPALLLTR
jgi:hypothetical protein